MPGPENNGPRLWRIPMSRIEKTVSAHLGQEKCGAPNKSGVSVDIYRCTWQGTLALGAHLISAASTIAGTTLPFLHAVSKVERLRTEDDSFQCPLGSAHRNAGSRSECK